MAEQTQTQNPNPSAGTGSDLILDETLKDKMPDAENAMEAIDGALKQDAKQRKKEEEVARARLRRLELEQRRGGCRCW